MPRKSTKYIPRCQLCGRMMNSAEDLTDMRKPGTLGPLRICSSQGCWEQANARGYLSSAQRGAADNCQAADHQA
jgi:hypothetical protein